MDSFLLRSKGSGVEDTSSTSQTFSVERINEEVSDMDDIDSDDGVDGDLDEDICNDDAPRVR